MSVRKHLTNQRPWNSLVEHPFRWMSEDVRLKIQSHLEISLTLDVWYAVCALCDLHANDGDDTQLSRYNHECLPQDVMLVPSQFDRFLSSTDQSVKGYRNIHDYQKWPLSKPMLLAVRAPRRATLIRVWHQLHRIPSSESKRLVCSSVSFTSFSSKIISGIVRCDGLHMNWIVWRTVEDRCGF